MSSGFIRFAASIQHMKQAWKMLLQYLVPWLSPGCDVQSSAVPSVATCLSEGALRVIGLGRRGQLDVTFVVSVFVVVF